MQRTDIPQIMLYGMQLWPRTFLVPQDERELALAERAWLGVLGDLDVDLVEAAMVSWDEHWPPSPKELRNAALKQKAIAEGEVEMPCLDEAWLEFKANYKSHGPWSHPAVEAAAHALGCREFGQSEVADEMAWRAHFIKLYGSASTRYERATASMPPVLAAYMENVLNRAPQSELDSGS